MYVGSPLSFVKLSIQTNAFGCKMSFYCLKQKICHGMYVGSPQKFHENFYSNQKILLYNVVILFKTKNLSWNVCRIATKISRNFLFKPKNFVVQCRYIV
jgi:hypothetical protein